MKTIKTRAIILTRTDYQEADRIINVLTDDQGKLALMARGVRKPKSKLASGIELFCVSSISYIKGRGDIGTLISAKPELNYDKIINDISRVQRGYNLIKILNLNTDQHVEDQYFEILQSALQALNDYSIDDQFTEAWFAAQILKIGGHTPNLISEESGAKLEASKKYKFNPDSMCFSQAENGNFDAAAIKCLRLMFGNNKPAVIYQIEGFTDKLPLINGALKQMREYHLS